VSEQRPAVASDSCNLVRDNATDADAAAAVDDPSRLTGQTKSL